MTKLTNEAAYLIKNGIPYEIAVGMSPAETKAAVRTMMKVEKRSPSGRLAQMFAGIFLIAIGFGGLYLLLPILLAVK